MKKNIINNELMSRFYTGDVTGDEFKMVLMAADIICKAVIRDINENKKVASAYGFSDHSLAFACSETGT